MSSQRSIQALFIPFDGVCWWCRQQPADSHEHKFKRSDLARMGGKSDELLWGTANGVVRAVRSISKRQVVRFDKTMCAYCNTTRSQSFDRAYEAFSKYLYEAAGSLRRSTGIDFTQVYGPIGAPHSWTWPGTTVSTSAVARWRTGCRSQPASATFQTRRPSCPTFSLGLSRAHSSAGIRLYAKV